eukprot:CAMPEP_0184396456 /NCGR_PEP_ID=MMETSP0007-20130409/51383_1 /TAXON_ID=97485 /ORGANISM="Prymnesium parvum, Strain Texoma1" /LENGTH=93 /DNA_ID=CAMNT_0026749225 /DNA_START=365 /DNA_END=646 /DNA_ORIENTATION=-
MTTTRMKVANCLEVGALSRHPLSLRMRRSLEARPLLERDQALQVVPLPARLVSLDLRLLHVGDDEAEGVALQHRGQLHHVALHLVVERLRDQL